MRTQNCVPNKSGVLGGMLVATLGTRVHPILVTPNKLFGHRIRLEQLVGTRVYDVILHVRKFTHWNCTRKMVSSRPVKRYMYSVSMDEARATPPNKTAILGTVGKFHFSRTLPDSTLLHAVETMVLSCSSVTRTIVITGRVKYFSTQANYIIEHVNAPSHLDNVFMHFPKSKIEVCT